jgi:archaellum component FlaF (FlaF/FlaG flagellin family)
LNKNILGLICILVLVVLVSGCIQENIQESLYTKVTTPQYNPKTHNYRMSVTIYTNGSAAFSDVKIELIGKDKNNKTVYDKTKTINYLPPSGSTVINFDIPSQKTTSENYELKILNTNPTVPQKNPIFNLLNESKFSNLLNESKLSSLFDR